MFAGKKSAQIREILISESAWEEMTCLFAPSLTLSKHPLSDHSAADSFWGPGVDGHGTNMTGQILMQIRRELQANPR